MFSSWKAKKQRKKEKEENLAYAKRIINKNYKKLVYPWFKKENQESIISFINEYKTVRLFIKPSAFDPINGCVNDNDYQLVLIGLDDEELIVLHPDENNQSLVENNECFKVRDEQRLFFIDEALLFKGSLEFEGLVSKKGLQLTQKGLLKALNDSVSEDYDYYCGDLAFFEATNELIVLQCWFERLIGLMNDESAEQKELVELPELSKAIALDLAYGLTRADQSELFEPELLELIRGASSKELSTQSFFFDLITEREQACNSKFCLDYAEYLDSLQLAGVVKKRLLSRVIGEE